MFVKVLTLLLVIGAIVWMVVPRRPVVGARGKPTAPRVPHAHDLEKCARCGIWLPTGQSCDCEARG